MPRKAEIIAKYFHESAVPSAKNALSADNYASIERFLRHYRVPFVLYVGTIVVHGKAISSPEEAARILGWRPSGRGVADESNVFLARKAEKLTRDERAVFDVLVRAPQHEAEFSVIEAKLHIGNGRVLLAADGLARRELASLLGWYMRLEKGAIERVRRADRRTSASIKGTRRGTR